MKYSFKNGALKMAHPFMGVITIDHLNGPKGERFIKALKSIDAKRLAEGSDKPGDGWMDRHLVSK